MIAGTRFRIVIGPPGFGPFGIALRRVPQKVKFMCGPKLFRLTFYSYGLDVLPNLQ
jgi:hypothetical protein